MIPKGLKIGRIKPHRAVDVKHKAFIESKPCCCCGGVYGVVWHHLLRIGREWLEKYPDRWGKSAGKRAHDLWTIPLCYDCHMQGVHGPRGEVAFLAENGIDGPELAETLARESYG